MEIVEAWYFQIWVNFGGMAETTVRASLSRMSISACGFLTAKQETRPWYSAKQ